MVNDKKIKSIIKKMQSLIDEFLAQPIQDAVSDSIVDLIIENAEKLQTYHSTNKPE